MKECLNSIDGSTLIELHLFIPAVHIKSPYKVSVAINTPYKSKSN